MSDWIKNSTILLVKAGSQAYGTANDMSDLDIRGVCVPPIEIRDDIFQNFTQVSSPSFVEKDFGHLINPKNPKLDSTIFDIRKFCKLAAECNPNILEILFTPYEDHLIKTEKGRLLFDNRKLFLSTRCAYTFSGYAIAQLKKIERHQKWIKNPPKEPPSRESFGLPPRTNLNERIESDLKNRVEKWNFSQFNLDDQQRKELKEEIFIIVRELTGQVIDWDNWPAVFKLAAIKETAEQLSLSEELLTILIKESQWRELNDKWANFLHWQKNRNQDRKILENKYLYDTKNGLHLVRLCRSGLEVLLNGDLAVKRHDAAELLEIKNGKWSYEQIKEYADSMQKEINDAKLRSSLPRETDKRAINELLRQILK